MPKRYARLRCPKCKGLIFGLVVEVRPYDDGMRRIRECEICGARYITKEKFCCYVQRRKRGVENVG